MIHMIHTIHPFFTTAHDAIFERALWLTSTHISDPWYRSNLGVMIDNFFGVEDYQLNQRYGRIEHEVVPTKITEGPCERLEKWANEKLGHLMYEPKPDPNAWHMRQWNQKDSKGCGWG